MSLLKSEHPRFQDGFQNTRRQIKAKKTKKRSKRKMSTSNPGRVKEYHHKSRTGCLTCRQRRVKCDEERSPNCVRCDKGGYRCEWQDQRVRRLLEATTLVSSPSSIYTDRSSALPTTTRPYDYTSLSRPFFTSGVAQNVIPAFTDMILRHNSNPVTADSIPSAVSNFFRSFVRTASETNPIVDKTLNAITGLYASSPLLFQGSQSSNTTFIAQYRTAVSDVRIQYSAGVLSPETNLITAILFANCEYILGDERGAMQQLRTGARLLHDYRVQGDLAMSTDLYIILETIFGPYTDPTWVYEDAF